MKNTIVGLIPDIFARRVELSGWWLDGNKIRDFEDDDLYMWRVGDTIEFNGEKYLISSQNTSAVDSGVVVRYELSRL